VSQAGAVLLTRGLGCLEAALSAGLERWRPSRAVHDPGKVIADLALALGGDCLADIAMLRAEPGLFGSVASDPVVSRLIGRLAADAPRALRAGPVRRPGASLGARRGCGHQRGRRADPGRCRRDDRHRLLREGPGGTGEPLAIMLRPRNAGPDAAADHVEVTRLALAQLPKGRRRQVLIRADSGGGTHEFLNWLARPGRRLAYSVGFTITEDIQDAIAKIPARA